MMSEVSLHLVVHSFVFKVEEHQLLGLNYFHRCLGNKASEFSCGKSSILLKNVLKVYNSRSISCLNKFDITTKGAIRFSKLQAPISTLTALRMLQPFGLLKCLVTLLSVSNHYVACIAHVCLNVTATYEIFPANRNFPL